MVSTKLYFKSIHILGDLAFAMVLNLANYSKCFYIYSVEVVSSISYSDL